MCPGRGGARKGLTIFSQNVGSLLRGDDIRAESLTMSRCSPGAWVRGGRGRRS